MSYRYNNNGAWVPDWWMSSLARTRLTLWRAGQLARRAKREARSC